MLRLSSYVANEIIYVSEAAAKSWKGTLGIKKGIAIPNCVELESIKHASTASLNVNKTNDIIIVAKFTEQKNPSKLIDVLSQFDSELSVNWYGKGPLEEKIKEKAATLLSCTKTTINFCGIVSRQNLLKEISLSRLYLALPLWEGIGVANIEALCLPTEVILSKIPPHEELAVTWPITLVDLDEHPKSIAEKIEKKLSIKTYDPRSYYQRQVAFMNNYNLENMLNNYIEVYQNVASSD